MYRKCCFFIFWLYTCNSWLCDLVNSIASDDVVWANFAGSFKCMSLQVCSLLIFGGARTVLFNNRSVSKLQTSFTKWTERNFSQKTLPWLGSGISFLRGWGQADPRNILKRDSWSFLSCVQPRSWTAGVFVYSWTRFSIKRTDAFTSIITRVSDLNIAGAEFLWVCVEGMVTS